jgi:hypothetical protein
MLYLSILTLGEIRKGVAALRSSKRRTRLETWLEVESRARFSDRILSTDLEVADRGGLLAAGSKAKGKTPFDNRWLARRDGTSPQSGDRFAQCRRLFKFARGCCKSVGATKAVIGR